MQSVHTLLKLAQLRWTGQVTRMPDERLLIKVLYGELHEGKRSQGAQKKRYKHTLKAEAYSCEHCLDKTITPVSSRYFTHPVSLILAFCLSLNKCVTFLMVFVFMFKFLS